MHSLYVQGVASTANSQFHLNRDGFFICTDLWSFTNFGDPSCVEATALFRSTRGTKIRTRNSRPIVGCISFTGDVGLVLPGDFAVTAVNYLQLSTTTPIYIEA